MGPEAGVVGSGSPRSAEVSTDRPHGKSPLVENPFYFARFVISTSSTPF